MGPQAPLTRAEERAALAGTITLIVVAALAMVEILLSRAPPEEPRGKVAAPVPAGQAARAPPAVPAPQGKGTSKGPQDSRAAP